MRSKGEGLNNQKLGVEQDCTIHPGKLHLAAKTSGKEWLCPLDDDVISQTDKEEQAQTGS